ncbi:acid sphingomyelinase-like phosphodiesterase 3b isoform X1 [Parasteatoda tepidariorum]|uniref:acid sphingomyelinase-like phosphodiesterase 3b isoform X1 n=2 Tax=Parasteatoda tepidariorum TaxID=114398 RepID=UPI001C7211CB|nr:acid sphingomyelinase-like phosphodiesterase 3b [Parasteatoda tepidariorum]
MKNDNNEEKKNIFEKLKLIGNFWFVSDFHVDQNYSREGNPTKLCHEDGSIHPDTGQYGNFLCDSPMTLINETVASMKNIQPNPDFIVWTGDNLPHTDDFNPDWDVTFEAINNITELLYSSFPNVPIYPCIGNHDTFPPNILLPDGISDTVYKGYLEKGGWNKLLSKNATVTFHQGGFYSEVIKPGLRLISLNTILWYFPNNYTVEIEDPANQFSWLKKVLNESSQLSEKVYIIGHVSPGFYSRGQPGKKSDPTYHLHFLEKYLDILHQYTEIIIGQMYGHFHLDFFQLFQFNTGSFKSSSILASSVTPWHSIDEFSTTLPVNPSFKLMNYSDSDFSLLDFEQFYMNLSKVNSLKETHLDPGHLYEPLYQFTTFYGVSDLSTNSLVKVYENLKKNDNRFQDFFLLLTAGKHSAECGRDCKIAQLCAMSGTSNEEYDQCMKTIDESIISKSTYSANVTTNILIAVFVSLLILCLLVTFILYLKYFKRANPEEYQPFLEF